MTVPTVREMTSSDCDRVAEIRVRGWQSAYRGLVPQPYLDTMDVRKEAEVRRALPARGDAAVVNLVADVDGEVTGWAAHGPLRGGAAPADDDAELYALYVRPDLLGRGIGRALLAESVRRGGAAGHSRMFLWVIRGNAPARRFYERAGFRRDGAEEFSEAGGARIPEVRYVRPLPGGGLPG